MEAMILINCLIVALSKHAFPLSICISIVAIFLFPLSCFVLGFDIVSELRLAAW